MESELLLVSLYFFFFFLPVSIIIGLCVAVIIQQAKKQFSYFRLFSHIGWLLIGIGLFSLFIAFTSPPKQKEFLLSDFGRVTLAVILLGSLLNVPRLWDTIIKMRLKDKKRSKGVSLQGYEYHCIPIDPHYLAWKLRTLNYKTRFIEVASEINGQMPRYVVERIISAMNEVGKCLNGSRILIVGVTYKRDVADLRESPAIDIIKLLRERKALVDYADPYIPRFMIGERTLTGVPVDDEHLRGADCVVIITDHRTFDYAYIARTASLVVDTRNATAGMTGSHIWRL